MANSEDPDDTACSGSALFAKVSVLVCRDEGFNELGFLICKKKKKDDSQLFSATTSG